MPKRALPAQIIYGSIDNYILFHFNSERDHLETKGLLHAFIENWETHYFDELRKIKNNKIGTDVLLNEEDQKAKYTNLAMEKTLKRLREDILFQR